MRAVDVGIRHDHDAVVPEAGGVELVTLDSRGYGTQRKNKQDNETREMHTQTASVRGFAR